MSSDIMQVQQLAGAVGAGDVPAVLAFAPQGIGIGNFYGPGAAGQADLVGDDAAVHVVPHGDVGVIHVAQVGQDQYGVGDVLVELGLAHVERRDKVIVGDVDRGGIQGDGEFVTGRHRIFQHRHGQVVPGQGYATDKALGAAHVQLLQPAGEVAQGIPDAQRTQGHIAGVDDLIGDGHQPVGHRVLGRELAGEGHSGLLLALDDGHAQGVDYLLVALILGIMADGIDHLAGVQLFLGDGVGPDQRLALACAQLADGF